MTTQAPHMTLDARVSALLDRIINEAPGARTIGTWIAEHAHAHVAASEHYHGEVGYKTVREKMACRIENAMGAGLCPSVPRSERYKLHNC